MSENNTSIRIAIGRNVKNEPMHSIDWDMFQAYVANGLGKIIPDNLGIEFHNGVGHWEGEDEDSAIISVIGANEFQTWIGTGAIRTMLSILKDRFFQDSIVLEIIEPEFIF